jgi:hypothetical protein
MKEIPRMIMMMMMMIIIIIMIAATQCSLGTWFVSGICVDTLHKEYIDDDSDNDDDDNDNNNNNNNNRYRYIICKYFLIQNMLNNQKDAKLWK